MLAELYRERNNRDNRREGDLGKVTWGSEKFVWICEHKMVVIEGGYQGNKHTLIHEPLTETVGAYKDTHTRQE